MKRVPLILSLVLVILVSIGCKSVPSKNTNSTDAKQNVETGIIRQERMIRLSMPLQKNDAEVYPEPWNSDYQILSGELPIEIETADTKTLIIQKTQTGFQIDGVDYSVLPTYGASKMLDGDGETQVFHRWTMDCAFLKWEGKTEEYKVYVPETEDSYSVLVLVNDSEQWLLAKDDSFLHEKEYMRTEYFGACQIGGKYYTNTAVFPHMIDEIMNDDAVPATLPKSIFYNNMPFTFECISVPGLSLTVHTLAFPNGENYVYNHKIHSFVKLSDHIDFDISLHYRDSQNNTNSTTMNDLVLTAQTPRYDSDSVYAKWSAHQPDIQGDYTYNWKSEKNRIDLKQNSVSEFEINGESYHRLNLAPQDEMGWKVDLGLFMLYGISENDQKTEILSNTEAEASNCVILLSKDETILLMNGETDSMMETALQEEKFGLCWINNGIILPASDATSLLKALRDRQNDNDIPVRFESTAYPGLSYCGWISQEQYQAIIPSEATEKAEKSGAIWYHVVSEYKYRR